MTQEETVEVGLREDFYRDSFGKVLFVVCSAGVLFLSLITLSVYLHMTKPPPITFFVEKEWRVQPPVPVQKAYLTNAALLQWVTGVVPNLFNLDFLHFDDELEDLKKYFTNSGYEVFLSHINNSLSEVVDRRQIDTGKLFLSGEPDLAPTVKNQGVLNGRYAWWVKFPIKISYAGMMERRESKIVLDVLVVRTDTIDSLTGVLIDNVIVESDADTGR